MRFNGTIPACVQRAVAAEIQRLREEVGTVTPRNRGAFYREIKALKEFQEELKYQNSLKRLFPVL